MKLTGKVWKFGNDIDTDLIIPARYLNNSDPAELAKHCMEDADKTWAEKVQKGDIIVAGKNFGCGSSREHAPWALLDFGFRAVISSEIADIFRGNSLKNGLLPIVVDDATSQWLVDNPGAEIDIDLNTARLTLPSGVSVPFPMEAFARHCLLNGIDELGYLRSKIADIERYEAAHKAAG